MERVPGQDAQPIFTPSELGHAALFDLRELARMVASERSRDTDPDPRTLALSSIACSQARIGMFLEQVCLELHELAQQVGLANRLHAAEITERWSDSLLPTDAIIAIIDLRDGLQRGRR
jgi:hypothetical protein